MSQRVILILWSLAIALAGVYFLIISRQDDGFTGDTARKRGEILLPDFPATEITRFTLSDGGQTTTLQKDSSSNSWSVDERAGFPADTAQINRTLRRLAELEVASGIEAGPSYLSRFGIDPKADSPEEHGIQLIFSTAKSEAAARLHIGKTSNSDSGPVNPFAPQMTNSGRFIFNLDDESGVYLVDDPLREFNPKPSFWLSNDFFRVENPLSIKSVQPNQADSPTWQVTRETPDQDFSVLGLSPNESPDTSATNPLKSVFNFPRFEDVLSTLDANKQLNDHPERRDITLTTADFLTYDISFAPYTPDEANASPEPQQYLLSFTVTANLPAPEAVDDETPAQDKKNDADSASDTDNETTATPSLTEADRRRIEEKVAKESKLANRVFIVNSFNVTPLLKSPDDFVSSQSATTNPVPIPQP